MLYFIISRQSWHFLSLQGLVWIGCCLTCYLMQFLFQVSKTLYTKVLENHSAYVQVTFRNTLRMWDGQMDFMVPSICSLTDCCWCQNVVRIKKEETSMSSTYVCTTLWCFLWSYWTNAWQHGIHLLYTNGKLKRKPTPCQTLLLHVGCHFHSLHPSSTPTTLILDYWLAIEIALYTCK